jgi:ribosomal-protein-alanine N-acetyltransferase
MTHKNSLFASFPKLQTQRLVLREITFADAPAIFHNYSDEDVTKWFFENPFTQPHQAEEIIREFGEKYQMGQGITWGISLKGENVLIGTCGFERFEVGGIGEIGFDLVKAYWGRGFIREALQSIITYGFERLMLLRIVADTYQTNTRSIRLLERLGFQMNRVEKNSFVYALERWDSPL